MQTPGTGLLHTCLAPHLPGNATSSPAPQPEPSSPSSHPEVITKGHRQNQMRSLRLLLWALVVTVTALGSTTVGRRLLENSQHGTLTQNAEALTSFSAGSTPVNQEILRKEGTRDRIEVASPRATLGRFLREEKTTRADDSISSSLLGAGQSGSSAKPASADTGLEVAGIPDSSVQGHGQAAKKTTKLPPGASAADNLSELLLKVAGPQGLVIWASASTDYLDLVYNWYTSVEKQGYGSRVLFVAEDEAALATLSREWPGQTISGVTLSAAQRELQKASHERAYGSSYYNTVVDRRPEYFLTLLNLDLNITFLYNDVDIVWLKDPFEFFKGDFDMWVPEDSHEFSPVDRFPANAAQPPDEKQDLCTCFMLVRPTAGSKLLLSHWMVSVRSAVRRLKKPVLNQPFFNKARNDLGHIRLGVLPERLFPSGCLYFGNRSVLKCADEHERYSEVLTKNLSGPVIVHNNWVRGHDAKVRSFQENGLWLTDSLSEWLLKLAGPRRLVIWAIAGVGYLDLVHNWYASVQAQGYGGNVLFVAKDETAFASLSNRWPGQTVLAAKLRGNGVEVSLNISKETADGPSTALSFFEEAVLILRPECFKAFLNLGLNITFLYNNVDVVWLGDPFKHLPEGFDVLMPEQHLSSSTGIQESFPKNEPRAAEKGQSLCLGFMLVRPTERSKKLAWLWATTTRGAVHRLLVSELSQSPLHQALRLLKYKSIRLGVLPPSLFPSSCLFFASWTSGPCVVHHQKYADDMARNLTHPVVVHSSWDREPQATVKHLKDNGLWMAGAQSNSN